MAPMLAGTGPTDRTFVVETYFKKEPKTAELTPTRPTVCPSAQIDFCAQIQNQNS